MHRSKNSLFDHLVGAASRGGETSDAALVERVFGS
jgi:hypothetical protein